MEFSPKYGSNKFKCPHCNTVSQQHWLNSSNQCSSIIDIFTNLYLNYRKNYASYQQEVASQFLSYLTSNFPKHFNSDFPRNISTSTCEACNKSAIWVGDKIAYPRNISVDPPNEDLTDEVKSLYNEASIIFPDSPKGSTALLRLALQTLLKQIGKKGDNINNDVKELVESGLSLKIQQALDLLRVVGNNAVHPGQINLDDNSEIAFKLFKIINLIADELITKPKEIDSLYNDVIPEKTKEHIKQRDGKVNNNI